MNEPKQMARPRMELVAAIEAAIQTAIRALAALDAEALDALADSLRQLSVRPGQRLSATEWERVRSGRWILENLIAGTAQRLAMLQRIGAPAGEWAGGRPTIRT